MAEKWTPEQQDAIAARGGPLLVSAAAGSGKTAVLVEHVISLLLDETNPVDADRVLVVTFTRAAAEVMRSRLQNRLAQALSGKPGSRFLQRQQILLSRAHIGTVDSFCGELVRENFFRLGIPADFRTADPQEIQVLRTQALATVLDHHYAAGDACFLELLETLSGGRDDRTLRAMVLALYDFVRSHPFPDSWLRRMASLYEAVDPDKSLWGRCLRAWAAETVAYCVQLAQEAAALLQTDEKLAAKCLPSLQADCQWLQQVQQALAQAPWDALGDCLSGHRFPAFGTPRGYAEDPVKLAAYAKRELLKKNIQRAAAPFGYTAAAFKEEMIRLHPLVAKLVEIVQAFGSELDARKLQRKEADFNDVAHWALRLLAEEDGTGGWHRTPFAREVAARYDAVLMDEYQDSNELQDLLFRAVSREEGNLFLVGDVKQSIYGFRQAEAGLFLKRQAASAVYDRTHPVFPACIALGRNFRSRAGITDAVNFFFGQLMQKSVGGLDYGEREALVCGASYAPQDVPAVELHVLEAGGPDGAAALPALEAPRIAALVLAYLRDGSVTQDGAQRKARFGDVCVLLRSTKGVADVYARELDRLGIPVRVAQGGSFFEAAEVRVALAFLQAVDNPLLDIPLLAVLASPVYGFSPDELASLRLQERREPLYHSLQRAAKENARCQTVLEDLARWRALAAGLPVSRFVRTLLEQSGYSDLVLAMRGGAERLANLRRLWQYAHAYEQNGAGGLSGFLRFIDRLQEQGGDLAASAPGAGGEDAVQIMSIHRSKGLEFPMVILAGCGKKLQSRAETLALHRELGAGVQLRDKDTGCRYDTLSRTAVVAATRRDETDEELRVLYVALTRARERLVMLCSLENVPRRLAALAAQVGQAPQLPAPVVRGAGCQADWLLLCALRHPDGAVLRELAGARELPALPAAGRLRLLLPRPAEPLAAPEEARRAAAQAQPALVAQLRHYVDFVYPYAALGTVRAKTAASSVAAAPVERRFAAMSRPAFLQQGGLTPAQRGTALHAFFQYASYTAAAQDAPAELRRLCALGFLTQEQADAVDLQAVSRFFSCEIGRRLLRSPRILREYRFSVELPAGRLDPALPAALAAEPVVVQGAVDCAFEEAGGLVLLDYKTDREDDPQRLWQRYRPQLALYREALQACLGLPVRDCLLYAFYLGQELRGV